MFGDVPLHIVRDASTLQQLVEALESASVIGVDTESNSMYVHTERVCLIQFSVIGSDWIVDPLAVKDLSTLAPVLADPAIPKVLHGADYDVRCLRRDFDFQFRGLFDTLIAAQLLAMPKIGLADLLDHFFGVEVDKQYQRYNWGLRPLEPEHLEYARGDTHYLMALRELFLRLLRDVGRIPHLEEECALMEELEFEPRVFDPDDAMKMKGTKGLSLDQQRVLRQLFSFRESEAARLDRPTYKVIPNHTLVGLAKSMPESMGDLDKHLSKRSAIRRKYAKRLLAEIVEGLDSDWKPSKSRPKRARRSGPPARLTGRAAERAMDALKAWRNNLIDREQRHTSYNMVSNAVLKNIASACPRDLDELGAVKDVRRWQVAEFGTAILGVLSKVEG